MEPMSRPLPPPVGTDPFSLPPPGAPAFPSGVTPGPGVAGLGPIGQRRGRLPPAAWVGIAALAVIAVVVVVAVAVNSTTDEPATASPSTSPTTSPTTAPPAADLPSDAVRFDDPQQTYTMEISADWVATSGTVVREIESWTVGPASHGFAPNVNILTQLAEGMDLAAYIEFSLQNIGGADIIRSSMIRGTAGNELALLEYEADVPGALSHLHFLATVDVRNEQAVVATFTAGDSSFTALRDSVEPFLRSLQAT